MRLSSRVLHAMQVPPGQGAALATRDTAAVTETSAQSKQSRTGQADEQLQSFTAELAAAQELLYASGSAAILVVLQGMDAAGKDGTIKHVMSGVNPQGCSVTSFKEPSSEELAHELFWRATKALPAYGHIGMFNRSHYEDVVTVRVHPNLLASRFGDGGSRSQTTLWEQRYDEINAFEQHLFRNDTRVVKIFLHVSKEVQRKRLLEHLEDPAKYWRFSPSDLTEHSYWEQYQAAYEEALAATSTSWAPWYVVPADHKHVMRALVAGILVHVIDDLHLSLPEVALSMLTQIDAARTALLRT